MKIREARGDETVVASPARFLFLAFISRGSPARSPVYSRFHYRWGQELEISSSPSAMEIFRYVRWHQDGSGPLEFTYGPLWLGDLTAPLAFTLLQLYGWVDLTVRDQMGCHLHISTAYDAMEAWVRLFGTSLSLVPFFVWLLGSHSCSGGTCLRGTAVERWALVNNDQFEYWRRVRRAAEAYRGGHVFDTFAEFFNNRREYFAVTLNFGPRTIELRLSEAHPLRAAAAVAILAVYTERRIIEPQWLDGRRLYAIRMAYEKFATRGVSVDTELYAPGFGRMKVREFARRLAEMLTEEGFDAEAQVLLYMARTGRNIIDAEDVHRFMKSEEGEAFKRTAAARVARVAGLDAQGSSATVAAVGHV